MKRYLVSPEYYKTPGFWRKIFIFLRLAKKKEPKNTFEIYINATLQPGEKMMTGANETFYILREII